MYVADPKRPGFAIEVSELDNAKEKARLAKDAAEKALREAEALEEAARIKEAQLNASHELAEHNPAVEDKAKAENKPAPNKRSKRRM